MDDTIVIDEIMYQKFPEKRLLTWSDAMEYSNWLNISKYKDWRLPRVEELERLFTKQVQRSIRGEEYFIIKEFVDYMPKEAKFWSASGDNWHEGVIGIVASRVARVVKKPVIVLTKSKDGLYKGSGRSFTDCDIFHIVDSARDIFREIWRA